MHRKSYAQEIGVETGDRVVPWPYVVIVLALLALGAWRGAGMLQARMDHRQEGERMSATAAAPNGSALAHK